MAGCFLRRFRSKMGTARQPISSKEKSISSVFLCSLKAARTPLPQKHTTPAYPAGPAPQPRSIRELRLSAQAVS